MCELLQYLVALVAIQIGPLAGQSCRQVEDGRGQVGPEKVFCTVVALLDPNFLIY